MAVDGLVLVTPEEAARRLSLGRTTVYGLISAGALESVRIGRSRRVPVAALDRYVERMASDGPEQGDG
jgi:excisionase family DNA binding protein